MTKQSRRYQSLGWDRESSQGLTHHAGNGDRPRQRLAQAFVLQWSALTVECRVVGYEVRDLVITGGKLRIAPQRLGVCRQQIGRQRKSTGAELREDVRRGDTEIKIESFNSRIAAAPVVSVSFELKAHAWLKL
ncbi:hypothetical protein BH18ACI4_BH18ACI4_06160 [soil metagenome]